MLSKSIWWRRWWWRRWRLRRYLVCFPSFVRSLFPFSLSHTIANYKICAILAFHRISIDTHTLTLRENSISRWNVFWVIRVYWLRACCPIVVVARLFNLFVRYFLCLYVLAIVFFLPCTRDTNSNKNCSYLKYLLSMFTIVRECMSKYMHKYTHTHTRTCTITLNRTEIVLNQFTLSLLFSLFFDLMIWCCRRCCRRRWWWWRLLLLLLLFQSIQKTK